MATVKELKAIADKYNSPEEVAKRNASLSLRQVESIKDSLRMKGRLYGEYATSLHEAFYCNSQVRGTELTDEAKLILEKEGFVVKEDLKKYHWTTVSIPTDISVENAEQSAPSSNYFVGNQSDTKDARPTKLSWFRAAANLIKSCLG